MLSHHTSPGRGFKRLAHRNSHPRDLRISLREQDHKYTINGVAESPISVTTLVYKYFPKFDPDAVIPRMTTNKYQGMTKEQIKQLWEQQGKEAAEKGTALHKFIEDYINGEPVTPTTKEAEYFITFWEDFKTKCPGYKPYRTEWMIYDEDKKVAGCIDYVAQSPTGELVLFDWKRTKELRLSNKYQKGFGCLQHLDNCNYVHYSLQLNMYRHILETKYGHKVARMLLVVLHPNNSTYLVADALDLRDEIAWIWDTL